MSTLKVTNIKHGSTTDGGIQLDNAGHVSVDGVQMPNAGPLSNRNLLFNGNFQINQRGGTNSTINAYSLDRWRSYGGPLGFTISQQDVLSTLSTSKYALRLQRTSGNTQTNNIGVAQGIESKNCEGLAGTKLTLSFKARVGGDFSQASDQLQSTVFYGQGTDENPVGMTSQTSTVQDNDVTTSFATFTQTVTVPANTTQISVGFSYTPAGTAGADDYFEISEVQLERGDVATPFEHRSFADELLKCQRYYQKSYNIDTSPGATTNVGSLIWQSNGSSGAIASNPVVLPTRMRAAPDVDVYSPETGAEGNFRRLTSTAADQTGQAYVIGETGFSLRTTGTATTNTRYNAHYTADSEL